MMGTKDQLTVHLSGGGPWGFRLQGGAGTGLPLVVAKVRRKSKAYRRLHEGDVIVSVNGTNCDKLTYDHVMEIADKSGSDLTLQVLRHESKGENHTVDIVDNKKTLEDSTVVKEVVSVQDTATKVTEKTEGLRIKSVTLMEDTSDTVDNKIDSFNSNMLDSFTNNKLDSFTSNTFDSFTSNKLDSFTSNKLDSFTSNNLDSFTSNKLKESEIKDVPEPDPFPSFTDILQTQTLPTLTDTYTKTEEIKCDDRNFEKTTTKTVHQVSGSTVVKEECESATTRVSGVPDQDGGGLPGITMDTIDLNNLISATQKKLDSFKDNFRADTTSSRLYEVKKTEISTTTSENKFSTVNSSDSVLGDLKDVMVSTSMADLNKHDPTKKVPPPTLPKPKIRPFSDTFLEHFKDLQMDLNSTLGPLGLVGSDTESSYFTSEGPFGTTHVTKKKKMFSSSSFYEEPHAIYPTVEEQVEMAKKIADSLADDTNKKSKGANMFFKRVKKSDKWIHEGPEGSDESAPTTPEVEPPTPDASTWRSKQRGPGPLRLVLDPRHTMDASFLKSSGQLISEHNVVSPQLCRGLVKDLQSPVGKGAALFAKRKKKSEEWVVDEGRVRALLRAGEERATLPTLPSLYQQRPGIGLQEMKLVKSPWEAAMESPIGACDLAFGRVHPDQLADTVIKAADYKRSNSATGSPPPPPQPQYSPYGGVYQAKAPKGWVPSADAYTRSQVPPAPVTYNEPQATPFLQQNGFAPVKKMVFQNFNTLPRLWRGSSAT